MPKHKATDKLQADLKSRIAKLRKQPKKKTGSRTFSHHIPREGAAQIALVGPANAGKSSLLRSLTHAKPEIAEYPFTTREATAGMMPFEDIGFQLVDLHGLFSQQPLASLHPPRAPLPRSIPATPDPPGGCSHKHTARRTPSIADSARRIVSTRAPDGATKRRSL